MLSYTFRGKMQQLFFGFAACLLTSRKLPINRSCVSPKEPKKKKEGAKFLSNMAKENQKLKKIQNSLQFFIHFDAYYLS